MIIISSRTLVERVDDDIVEATGFTPASPAGSCPRKYYSVRAGWMKVVI